MPKLGWRGLFQMRFFRHVTVLAGVGVGGLAIALAAQAGCNDVSECSGMVGSLMALSFESLVMDNDLLGAALRTVRGWVQLTVAYASFGFAYILVLGFLVARLEDDAGFSPGAATAMFSLVGAGSVIGGLESLRRKDE